MHNDTMNTPSDSSTSQLALPKGLPLTHATYKLVGPWPGKAQMAGRNWEIECTICGRKRCTNTSTWKAGGRLSCVCSKRFAKGPGRRSVVYLTHNGETRTIAEWAKTTGISKQAIYNRLRYRDANETDWSDERVIFGADPHNELRNESALEADLQIERSLVALERKLEPMIKEQVEQVVATFISDHLRPLLYSWFRSGRLGHAETVEQELRKKAERGMQPAAWHARDGRSWYDPLPHPDDSLRLFPNATYRDVRMDVGDEGVVDFMDPEFLEGYKAMNDGQFLYFSDLVAQEQAAKHNQDAVKLDEIRLRSEDERRKEQARRQAERESAPWRYISPLHTPYHSLAEESVLSDRLPDNFPKQEDTLPLSQAEVDDFLHLPWFKEREGEVFNGTDWVDNQLRPDGTYGQGFGRLHVRGGVMRTMYDRIEAWNTPGDMRYEPQQALSAHGLYTFCTDHRTTNHVLDVLYCVDWASRKRFAKGEEWDEVVSALSARFKKWQAEMPSEDRSGFHRGQVRRVLQAISLRAADSPLRQAIEDTLDFSF